MDREASASALLLGALERDAHARVASIEVRDASGAAFNVSFKANHGLRVSSATGMQRDGAASPSSMLEALLLDALRHDSHSRIESIDVVHGEPKHALLERCTELAQLTHTERPRKWRRIWG